MAQQRSLSLCRTAAAAAVAAARLPRPADPHRRVIPHKGDAVARVDSAGAEPALLQAHCEQQEAGGAQVASGSAGGLAWAAPACLKASEHIHVQLHGDCKAVCMRLRPAKQVGALTCGACCRAEGASLESFCFSAVCQSPATPTLATQDKLSAAAVCSTLPGAWAVPIQRRGPQVAERGPSRRLAAS